MPIKMSNIPNMVYNESW